LSEHLPAADCVEVASTARAAELAAGEETSAAIASSMAGEFFGLPVLAASIQDSPGNLTRFFVLGNQETQPSGLDKTSVMFAVKDQPGALAKALQPFEKAGVSLTRIESRPSKRRPWEYYFFADFAGHAADPSISAALGDLQVVCAFTRILGSYPDSRSS
jgi:chorismate mutase/prephenate dehydratase